MAAAAAGPIPASESASLIIVEPGRGGNPVTDRIDRHSRRLNKLEELVNEQAKTIAQLAQRIPAARAEAVPPDQFAEMLYSRFEASAAALTQTPSSLDQYRVLLKDAELGFTRRQELFTAQFNGALSQLFLKVAALERTCGADSLRSQLFQTDSQELQKQLMGRMERLESTIEARMAALAATLTQRMDTLQACYDDLVNRSLQLTQNIEALRAKLEATIKSRSAQSHVLGVQVIEEHLSGDTALGAPQTPPQPVRPGSQPSGLSAALLRGNASTPTTTSSSSAAASGGAGAPYAFPSRGTSSAYLVMQHPTSYGATGGTAPIPMGAPPRAAAPSPGGSGSVPGSPGSRLLGAALAVFGGGTNGAAKAAPR